MKKYPKYNPSGVEWIGDVPEHWKMKRVQYAFGYLKTLINTQSLAGQEVYHYSIPNVQEFNDSILEEGNEIDSDKLLVEGGEILVSKLNPRKNTVILTKKKEKTSICSSEFIPLKPILYDEKYAFYFLSCSKIADFLNSAVESATRSHQRVKPDILLKQALPIPPLPEQTAIAAYLDRKTAQIDQSIAEKERLIELFREERQAIINHAVTKGIRPGAKMKPSGVEWIGDVPEGWEVSQIKRAVNLLTDYDANGSFSTIKENVNRVDDKETQFAWLVRATDLENNSMVNDPDSLVWVDEQTFNYLSKSSLEEGDLLVVKRGEIGKLYLMPKFEKKASLAPNMYLVRLNVEKLIPAFAYFFLQSESGNSQLKLYNKSTTLGALYKDDFKSIIIVFPSVKEQKEIVAYLDQKTAQIDTAISGIRQEIALLQEYRQALIFEAVTGKVDVQGKENPT